LHFYLGLLLHLFIHLRKINKYNMSINSTSARSREIICLDHLSSNDSQRTFFPDRRRRFQIDANLWEGATTLLLFLSHTCSVPLQTPHWWPLIIPMGTMTMASWTNPRFADLVGITSAPRHCSNGYPWVEGTHSCHYCGLTQARAKNWTSPSTKLWEILDSRMVLQLQLRCLLSPSTNKADNNRRLCWRMREGFYF